MGIKDTLRGLFSRRKEKEQAPSPAASPTLDRPPTRRRSKRAASKGPKFRRGWNALPSRFGGFNSLRVGVGGLGDLNGDGFFAKSYEEIGEFNPIYVPPLAQVLMLRNPMVRLARIVQQAAIESRTFSLSGGSRDARAFHNAWIQKTIRQILKRVFNALWFGSQSFVVDWRYARRWPEESASPRLGACVPCAFHALHPLRTWIMQDEAGRPAGIEQDGEAGMAWPEDRTLVMTWGDDWGNPYGEGQAFVAYADWFAYSKIRLWMMRYLQKSAEPTTLVFAADKSIPIGEDEEEELSVLAGQIMDGADAGDTAVLPNERDELGHRLVEIDQLAVEDREDIFLKTSLSCARNIFRAAMTLPTSGIDDEGNTTYSGDREAKEVQWMIWDLVVNIAVDALNGCDGRQGLIERTHRLNRLEGPAPVLAADPFKKEIQEQLSQLFTKAMDVAIPEIVNGQATGKRYRPREAVDWEAVMSRINVPAFDTSVVARAMAEEELDGSDLGGRPPEPFGQRADDRHHGLER